VIVSVITSRFSTVYVYDLKTATAPPPPLLEVSPSYNLYLAPGFNFRELDLPNLDILTARLHPGFPPSETICFVLCLRPLTTAWA
jgi:hypothetical protein